MLQGLLVLGLLLGAWRAWRGDPAYSGKETLRRGVAVLLAVAALVVVLVTAVRLSIHRGPVVAGWTMGITVVVATAGFVWALMAVSAPKHEPLPEGTVELRTNRRSLAGQAKVFGLVTLGVLAVSALSTMMRWEMMMLAVGMMGGMLVLIWGICLFALYVKAAQMDRVLTAERVRSQR